VSVLLPPMFLVLAAAALFAALYSLWASFRSAFGALDAPDLQGTVEAMSRHQLLEEKRALLENLKDLRFDMEAGKLSQEDFDRLEARLRARAKEVLRLLDADAEPFRRKAEALIAERLKARPQAPYRDEAKPVRTRKECPRCDTTNDGDAAFCKRCGHSFAELEGDDHRVAVDDADAGDEGEVSVPPCDEDTSGREEE